MVRRDDIVSAAGTTEWARRVRDLRAEGWNIEATAAGYRLVSLVMKPGLDTAPISAKQRYRILERDGSRCQRCGNGVKDLEPGEKLMVDHRIARAGKRRGKTEDDNLWTLCSPCNLGKKNLFGDMDTEAVQRASEQTSGLKRLAAYIRTKGRGEILRAWELRSISGIHEHARRMRELRALGWPLKSHLEAVGMGLRSGDYIMDGSPPPGPDDIGEADGGPG